LIKKRNQAWKPRGRREKKNKKGREELAAIPTLELHHCHALT